MSRMHTIKSFLFYSLIALFAYSLIGLLTPPVYAQGLGCNLNDPNSHDVTIPCEREGYTQGREGGLNSSTTYSQALKKIGASMSDEIGGVISFDPNNPEKTTPYLHNSAIGKLGSSIAMMYQNPPADFGLWIADTGASLGFLPKPAYAQGLGFSGLSLLLPIWKAFRNLSYFLLAVVMVVIGFMVMFRKKIDPKTVVTVQNALPRIVMTLILITFSYAIVGLLIDAMYLIMIVVIGLLASASANITPAITTTSWVSDYTSSSFWIVIRSYLGSFRAVDDIILFFAPHLSALSPPQNWLLNFFGQAVQDILALSGSILFLVLITFAILFMVIRIFFMLLNAYIHIIIALLIGPLQILLDVFPGGTGFSSWIKNLVANLIVFPLTAFMLLIGYILMRSSLVLVWTPPLLGTGGGGTAGIIGLGILMAIPGVVNSIKEGMKAKPLLSAGPGAIFAPVAGVAQSGLSISQQFFYGQQAGSQILGWIRGKKSGAPPSG